MTIEELAKQVYNAIPEREKQRAESVRAMGEAERWMSGDLAADLIDELDGHYPKSAVRMAVAMLYHASESTIRDREAVCRRVPAALRDAHPAITYHYWRAASHAGDRMLRYVGEVEAHLEAWDALPTVSQVYGWIKNNDRVDYPPVWITRIESMLTLAEKIKHDDRTPSEVCGLMGAIVSRLDTIRARANGRYGRPFQTRQK